MCTHKTAIYRKFNTFLYCIYSTAPSQAMNMRVAGSSWVAGGRIYQPIAWDAPRETDMNEAPETYVVRYKNVTTTGEPNQIVTNTSEPSLNLSLPLPTQAVMYTVSVAGMAGTEQGQFSEEIIVNYSSMILFPVCVKWLVSTL